MLTVLLLFCLNQVDSEMEIILCTVTIIPFHGHPISQPCGPQDAKIKKKKKKKKKQPESTENPTETKPDVRGMSERLTDDGGDAKPPISQMAPSTSS
ncbi:hypothetical protein EYF80_034901 [Liparis tanakae]|uniref:Uncharacterized protein n=1 Tax=Liparis tanakae TaxID=230148 RepID=A0A4Z2GNK8_9TELE|nr:hypothetical protein EYF80_034901 [Liparis tanakae]